MSESDASVQMFVQHLRHLKTLHQEINSTLVDLMMRIRDSRISHEDQVDLAWLTQQAAKYAEEIRKEANRTRTLCETSTCVKWAVDAQTSGMADSVIGFIARGTPDVTVQPESLPKPGEPEYLKLVGWLGLPTSIADCQAFRLHWPQVCELLKERAAKGLGPPPGIKAMRPRYTLKSLRPKRGVNVEEIYDGQDTDSESDTAE